MFKIFGPQRQVPGLIQQAQPHRQIVQKVEHSLDEAKRNYFDPHDIASEWHGGMNSPLYSYLSTKKVHGEAHRTALKKEIQGNLDSVAKSPKKWRHPGLERARLQHLMRHVSGAEMCGDKKCMSKGADEAYDGSVCGTKVGGEVQGVDEKHDVKGFPYGTKVWINMGAGVNDTRKEPATVIPHSEIKRDGRGIPEVAGAYKPMNAADGHVAIRLPSGKAEIYHKGHLVTDRKKAIPEEHPFEQGSSIFSEASGRRRWMAGAVQHPGALRRTAKSMGLIKGDQDLSHADLDAMEQSARKSGNSKLLKRVNLARTFMSSKHEAQGHVAELEKQLRAAREHPDVFSDDKEKASAAAKRIEQAKSKLRPHWKSQSHNTAAALDQKFPSRFGEARDDAERAKRAALSWHGGRASLMYSFGMGAGRINSEDHRERMKSEIAGYREGKGFHAGTASDPAGRNNAELEFLHKYISNAPLTKRRSTSEEAEPSALASLKERLGRQLTSMNESTFEHGAYIYQGALHCEDCGERIKKSAVGLGSKAGDSDHYPQGPYPQGGGEADSPQHCASCGKFLRNPLTRDGETYVRTTHAEKPTQITKMWMDHYSYLKRPSDES